MNITQEKTDDLNLTLAVEIGPEDYEERVTRILRDYRKKARLDGFRPGHVPLGLIKKMYGTPVLVDEVNKILNEAVTNYIRDNKLNVLGEPLPNEEKKDEFDWNKDTVFRFYVDLGLAPDPEINLSKRIKVPYYKIRIDDELLQETIDNYLAQLGSMVSVDEVDDEDMLEGTLTEANEQGEPLPDGHHAENAVINMPAVTDKKTRKELLGRKKGDKVIVPLEKVIPDEEERANTLKIKKEELADLSPYFLFEIRDIRRFQKAEENQETYDRLFGKDVVKDHDTFVQKIRESLEYQLGLDSNAKYQKDVRKKLLSLIEVPLPKDFLKRWLIATNKEKYTPEQIEKEFDLFLEDLRWQIIRDKIAASANIQVTHEEIKEYAKALTREQFRQYGLGNLPDEQIEQYANEILKKEDEYNRIVSSILNNKVFDHLKSVIKLDEKEVSRDKFRKILEEDEKKDEKEKEKK